MKVYCITYHDSDDNKEPAGVVCGASLQACFTALLGHFVEVALEMLRDEILESEDEVQSLACCQTFEEMLENETWLRYFDNACRLSDFITCEV